MSHASSRAALPFVSRSLDLDGVVHYADYGGEGKPLVLVHGLGGSHLSWLAAAPLLARGRRVLALDLRGFGRTPPAAERSGVPQNRVLLDRFLDEVVKEPATLAGNSMGGLISLLEAAAHPEKVERLVLVNPAQPVPVGAPIDPLVAKKFALYALPWVGPRALQAERALGAERMIRERLEVACHDATRVPEWTVQASIAFATERLAEHAWADRVFLEAARSVLGHLLRRSRFAAHVAAVKAPTLLLHGEKDRLIPVAASRRLATRRPDWRFHELAAIGHVPQVEDPEGFAALVLDWLAG